MYVIHPVVSNNRGSNATHWITFCEKAAYGSTRSVDSMHVVFPRIELRQ
ncbi:hypothetical protein PG5_42220 [Pseudomonas sp. G5(2012)]|nr:hypothetical protein PG5_42220 [Pseudomonas sp. G5(2012)]